MLMLAYTIHKLGEPQNWDKEISDKEGTSVNEFRLRSTLDLSVG
jgi:hypothetical protein